MGFGDVVLPTLPSVRRLGINQRADYPVSRPPAATRSAAMARARPIRSAPMAMSARCYPTEQAVLTARSRALGTELQEVAA